MTRSGQRHSWRHRKSQVIIVRAKAANSFLLLVAWHLLLVAMHLLLLASLLLLVRHLLLLAWHLLLVATKKQKSHRIVQKNQLLIPKSLSDLQFLESKA